MPGPMPVGPGAPILSRRQFLQIPNVIRNPASMAAVTRTMRWSAQALLRARGLLARQEVAAQAARRGFTELLVRRDKDVRLLRMEPCDHAVIDIDRFVLAKLESNLGECARRMSNDGAERGLCSISEEHAAVDPGHDGVLVARFHCDDHGVCWLARARYVRVGVLLRHDVDLSGTGDRVVIEGGGSG